MKKYIHIDTNILLIITILVSTLSIIWSIAFYSKQVSIEVSNTIMENEYKEIGGKDNYTILKELQKEEMVKYIHQLKKENPEHIYNIRQKSIKEVSNQANMLNWRDLLELKSGSYIKGNSGALLTFIEFSDLECPYCISYHNNGTIDSTLNEFNDDVNYIFKNFPLPIHKNSEKEALAGKCIEKLSNGENYLSYIDSVFSNTLGGGEGYDLENIATIVKDFNIEEKSFDDCYSNESNLELVKTEFEQGRKFGINSTPSSVIINNTTGEFIVLSGSVEQKELEDTINILKK
ncbi:hypothetical protein A9Q91_01300 [Candidatus Gracilibacteria bacterium 28_42_T64]|nr:hypothetical protein A9Q91_01300 [Candidatus Gracilibacteria bacterium 28_42_T64]